MRVILNLKLNGGNVISSINSWAMLLIRYGAAGM